MKIPRFIARWVTDIALRMACLTHGGLIIGACQYDFLWSTWKTEDALGATQKRVITTPAWSRIGTIRETRVTMADGYYFQSYSDGQTL